MAADFILEVVISKDVLLLYVVDVQQMTDARQPSKCQIYSKISGPECGRARSRNTFPHPGLGTFHAYG